MSRQQFNNAKEDIAFPVEPYLNVLRSNNEATLYETDAKITPVSEMTLPGLEIFSIGNLHEAQEVDYWYEAIEKYIMKNELPLSKKLAQRILLEHQDYIIINNILYHVWVRKGKNTEQVEQICITDIFIRTNMESYAYCTTSGTFGYHQNLCQN